MAIAGNKKGSAPDKKQIRFPTFWSYSRWSTWKSCPRKYKHGALEKLPQPDNPFQAKGIEVHKLGEYFLRKTVKGIPKAFKHFKIEMNALLKLGAEPEADVAVTKDWKKTKSDNWALAWLRTKTDAKVEQREDDGLVITIIDFKTGRVYDSHEEQAEIMAAAVAGHEPMAKTIDVEFWYLDSGESKSWSFPRSVIKKLQKKWGDNAAKMLNDRKWPMKPSTEACKWCPFRTDKGGPCDGWKRAR